MLLAAVGLLVIGYLLLGWQLIGSGTSGSVVPLLPGLLVIGLGQGIALNSLTPLVLTEVDPAHVGSVSGVLATVQQVGSAVGVAVVGLVFFGLADRGSATALTAVVMVLGVLMLVVALLAGSLPDRRQGSHQTR